MAEQVRGSASAEPIPFTLLGDEPRVTTGSGARRDPLEFDAQAHSLAQLILKSRSSTPFTVGIEAGWGMGKSSLMRSLDAQLHLDPTVETVWFNAWTAQRGQVLEGLIKSVLNQLDDSVLRKAARNEQLIGWLHIAMLSAASLFGLGSLADEIWKRISLDPRARNDARALMQQAMAAWRGKNTGAQGRLLVVFVDDLDRCSPENVFQAFEAMKLYLDAAGFVFVVGYDADVISDAILREKMYGQEITSRGYIEKIVQIVHRIPPPGDDAAAAFLEDCLRESGTTDLFNEAARALVTDRNARNPRRIKRFLNSFVLGYGLDQTWGELGVSSRVVGEVGGVSPGLIAA